MTRELPASVWIYDLTRDVPTRLTFEAYSSNPAWALDGTEIAFSSKRNRLVTIVRTRADGTEAPVEVHSSNYFIGPYGWSQDTRLLLYGEGHPETDGDIWILPLEGDRTPRPFLRTKADEGGAALSPDGGFLAYVSNASGRPEIYVEAFPGPGGKWQISTDGGTEPRWSRSGKELFYRDGSRMMSVDVETEPAFAPRKPRPLFEDRYARDWWFNADYDVGPDGERFLMVEAGDVTITELTVVTNWATGGRP
jgi:serine/threonine-protein kinase